MNKLNFFVLAVILGFVLFSSGSLVQMELGDTSKKKAEEDRLMTVSTNEESIAVRLAKVESRLSELKGVGTEETSFKTGEWFCVAHDVRPGAYLISCVMDENSYLGRTDFRVIYPGDKDHWPHFSNYKGFITVRYTDPASEKQINEIATEIKNVAGENQPPQFELWMKVTNYGTIDGEKGTAKCLSLVP